MTGKTFWKLVANGETDVIGIFLAIVQQAGSAYCVIGGLGVNAYAEPVVSLDLDVVVVSDRIPAIRAGAEANGMRVEEFEHRLNLSMPGSDVRIQLHTDSRYQNFLKRSAQRNVLGYSLSVASLQDVLRGKVWAYSDAERRKSKRQKDLSDIIRLVDAHPELRTQLPPEIVSQLD
jgi:hypothetical protein